MGPGKVSCFDLLTFGVPIRVQEASKEVHWGSMCLSVVSCLSHEVRRVLAALRILGVAQNSGLRLAPQQATIWKRIELEIDALSLSLSLSLYIYISIYMWTSETNMLYSVFKKVPIT